MDDQRFIYGVREVYLPDKPFYLPVPICFRQFIEPGFAYREYVGQRNIFPDGFTVRCCIRQIPGMQSEAANQAGFRLFEMIVKTKEREIIAGKFMVGMDIYVAGHEISV